MYYDKIRHRHSQVLAATGLTPVEFDALLVAFKYHWDEYYSHFTLEGKVRQRISYNRKTSVLPLIQDKMFFILVYLKTNPLQELHAIQFEMTQPQANRWIHLLSEILRRTLKTLGELPDRNSKRLIHILQGCEGICFLSSCVRAAVTFPCKRRSRRKCDGFFPASAIRIMTVFHSASVSLVDRVFVRALPFADFGLPPLCEFSLSVIHLLLSVIIGMLF